MSDAKTERGNGDVDIPLWMLLVRLAAVAYGLRSKLHEPIVELAMGPVVFWIGRITKTKGCKLHLLQTSRPQSITPDGLPEFLTVGWQFALARGGNGYQDDMMLQQLSLPRVNHGSLHTARPLTYKSDGVQLSDFRGESQSLSDPSHLLSHILRVACFRAVDDQGAARVQWTRHGGKSAIRLR
jgi:hypothetical protein